MKHLKQCSCGRRVFRFAVTAPREMCAACYYHQNKGRVQELRKLRKPCSVEGCADPSVAKGYCDKHYRRFAVHGTPTPEGAENWGQAHGHPLYDTWRTIRRSGYSGKRLDPTWKSFWQFVRDMGDKPSARHKLARYDTTQPFCASNCYWKEPLTDLVFEGDGSKEIRAAYMRAYRIREPRITLSHELKKRYGIDIAQYEAMVAKQNGCCAICKQPERKPSRTSDGTIRRLCVDHCHKTNRVRALLCSRCNVIIGFADENPGIMEAAIAYLKKHAST